MALSFSSVSSRRSPTEVCFSSEPSHGSHAAWRTASVSLTASIARRGREMASVDCACVRLHG
jgi:hypothetical protein